MNIASEFFEEKDANGLYKLARAGKIKAECQFHGHSYYHVVFRKLVLTLFFEQY